MNGMFHWISASPEKRQKSYDTCGYIVKMLREVGDTGKPCIMPGKLMREGWEFQYNPEKGETPEGELEKYLAILAKRGVLHEYDHRKDEYYFYLV